MSVLLDILAAQKRHALLLWGSHDFDQATQSQPPVTDYGIAADTIKLWRDVGRDMQRIVSGYPDNIQQDYASGVERWTQWMKWVLDEDAPNDFLRYDVAIVLWSETSRFVFNLDAKLSLVPGHDSIAALRANAIREIPTASAQRLTEIPGELAGGVGKFVGVAAGTAVGAVAKGALTGLNAILQQVEGLAVAAAFAYLVATEGG